MVQALDDDLRMFLDEPATPTPRTVAQPIRTGARGRPRIHVDHALLAEGLEITNSTQFAALVGCSSRTIRRRALEQGLVQPGAPVYRDVVGEDGVVRRIYQPPASRMSNLTDNELDTIIQSTLEIFPNFGRSMVQGSLRAAGHRVPMTRIAASLRRVRGAAGVAGRRAIHRSA